MSKYGDAALEAVRNLKKWSGDPHLVWERAMKEQFGRSLTAQRKSCPRSAFFPLIAADLIDGIPAKECDLKPGPANARYAVRAVELLKKNPAWEPSAVELWRRVIGAETKAHNGQMNVVLALWQADQIRGRKR